MGQDVAELGLVVDSSQILRATKRLKGLEKQGARNESSAKKLTRSFGLMKTAVVGLFAAMAVRKVVNTAAAFETMKISLETVTGSAKKAQLAFDGILDFASNTPFQVSELTDAFIKLKALGLEPSEASLTSFGNTASAMGRSLNQMIEAVADAATGEFERLKEFGIKAKSEGDNVTFTFQGIATTVKKNAADIEGYLRSIGEVQFAGAMEKQMDTVNGAFSNAADAVDQLIVALGESGLNRAIAAVTNSFTFMVRAIKEFVDPSIKTQMVDIKEEMIEIGKQIQQRVARRVNFGDLQQELDVLSKQYAALQSQIKTGKIEEAGESTNVFTGKTVDEMQEDFDIAASMGSDMVDLYKMNAESRADAELAVSNSIISAQMNTFSHGAALISMFATKSKSAAFAAIALQKGLAIAQTVINTNVAAIRALAELGPIAGPPAAATIKSLGAAAVGLISATGLVQASQLQAREKGGPVTGNRPYLVGERGPEIFTPASSGNIIPNDKMGGAVNQINVTVYANDAQSFEDQQNRTKDNIWNIIMDRMNEEGLSHA